MEYGVYMASWGIKFYEDWYRHSNTIKGSPEKSIFSVGVTDRRDVRRKMLRWLHVV
jgi:hypothetical protein